MFPKKTCSEVLFTLEVSSSLLEILKATKGNRIPNPFPPNLVVSDQKGLSKLAVPKFSREPGQVSNFNKSID